MNKLLLWVIGIVIIAVISFSSINSIPKAEINVEANASQLLNQYKRRAELVPQLVEIVKGAANYEKTTLETVVEARSSIGRINISAKDLNNVVTSKKFFNAQAKLGESLGRLLAVAEKYPELKATQNFLTLQSQIEGNENRIAVARRDYINSVRDFNIKIKTFPGIIWNQLLFHHKKIENFTDEESIKETPKINFN